MGTPRPNRLVLFLDGTWNTLDDNTNVWRMKSLCAQNDQQKVYYSAGVGTQKGEKYTGGLFGIGIDAEVTTAYEWLIEHYEEHSQIFIFGFSRGAFTARSLAGFISKCGLLKRGSPMSLKQLYERYRKNDAPSILAIKQATEYADQEERWLARYSQAIPVWFQGVWDTVGELGVPLPFLPHVSKNDFSFLETDLRINQTHAYHALAIDEHREAFKPTLWTKLTPANGASPEPRDLMHVEQRWFVGAHANIGGGYENDLLAQAPLHWLMGKAAAHGLDFRDAVELDPGATHCPVRDSLKEMVHGVYAAFHQPYFRNIGAQPLVMEDGTLTTINETIDRSVFERVQADAAYRPQNLMDWASRYKVDPSKLLSSVMADRPDIEVPN